MDGVQRGQGVSVRFGASVIGATLLFAVAVMVYLCWIRGIWKDEIWSIWVSRHDLPLEQLVPRRWLKDVHPPLFTAINWLFDPITGANITARRLLNLMPLAGLGFGGLYIARRDPRIGPTILVFFCLLAANRYFGVYFAEHRPYFLLEAFYALSLLSLYGLSVSGADFDRAKDLPLALLLAVATVLSLNSHYVSAFIAAFPIGCVLLDQLRQRHWRWSGWILGVIVLSILPLLAAFYLQLAYIGPTTANLWISTGFGAGIKGILRVGFYCATNDWVAAIAAVLAVALAVRARRAGPDKRRDDPAVAWSFVIAVMAGLALSALAMIVINKVKPIIEPRYLTPFAPAISLVVAILATRLLFSRRLVLVAFALNAVVATLFWADRETRTLRWYDTARYIQAQVARCPTTRVYAVDPAYIAPYIWVEGDQEVQAWGYRLVSGYFGFDARVIQRGTPLAIGLAAHCPTLFWAEHVPWQSAGQLQAADFAQSLPPGRKLTSAGLYRGDTGFVLSLRP